MSRLYFETEIVRVKKEKKERFCPCCGYESSRETEHEKPEGNWINGENLDKIKFPCFCSYEYDNVNCHAMIVMDYVGAKDIYSLINIDDQNGEVTCAFSNESLEELIRVHDIHILKGKIILFEEQG